jgi:hypothetical protein
MCDNQATWRDRMAASERSVPFKEFPAVLRAALGPNTLVFAYTVQQGSTLLHMIDAEVSALVVV